MISKEETLPFTLNLVYLLSFVFKTILNFIAFSISAILSFFNLNSIKSIILVINSILLIFNIKNTFNQPFAIRD